jgi:hypothetical protein
MPISISIADRVIRLQTPYDMKDKCTAIPGGKWVPKHRAWEFALTPATINEIIKNFGKDITLDLNDFSQAIQSVNLAKEIKEAPIETLPRVPVTKTEPWEHQRRAYWFVTKLLGLEQ